MIKYAGGVKTCRYSYLCLDLSMHVHKNPFHLVTQSLSVVFIYMQVNFERNEKLLCLSSVFIIYMKLFSMFVCSKRTQ
jgi:hypothetical protein